MTSQQSDDWRAVASWEVLEVRAAMLVRLRRVFEQVGFLEVETPLLSRDVCVDEHIEPFVVPGPDGDTEFFLQTSPEFAMKRLVAQWGRPIFQVTRAFRCGETGTRHNPEFTIVEWYEPGSTYLQQMDLVESVVRGVAEVPADAPPWVLGEGSGERFGRISYDEAFDRAIGVEVLGRSTAEVIEVARRELETVPDGLDESDRDAWLNLLLSERVEPTLGRNRPEFLFDYPASQAALARVRHGEIDVAERMELFIDGLEICNGYQELIDADELAERMASQSRRRVAAGRRGLPVTSRLEMAQRVGLPDCAGVALGFDRLVMRTLGLERIEQSLVFPFARA
ncbi:MAG: EF-P lysine aminoacylase EpmA [Planctomycetota bacterium]|nr:EF-P lysine aminoacylase EpmA [Planctomycetota bacterium]